MDKLLVRLLLALQWTCDPKPEGAPADTEGWDSPDGTRHFWVLREDACAQNWQQEARIMALHGCAFVALGLHERHSRHVELGRRLGRLESAEEALKQVTEIESYAGTGGFVDSDPRAIRVLQVLAKGDIEAAGLTLARWLAARAEGSPSPPTEQDKPAFCDSCGWRGRCALPIDQTKGWCPSCGAATAREEAAR